jgi:ferrochelatase
MLRLMVETMVILSYHGTVADEEELPGFLKNIGRGRPAAASTIAEVARRLNLIGGSPLRRTAEAQAAALEERLGLPVRAAARLWHPYPSEVLAPWIEQGIKRVVSLPLAPQSVHIYHPDVEAALAGHSIELVCAPAWGNTELLHVAFLEAIAEAGRRLTADDPKRLGIILSAHSLPTRIIDGGDPYERDFRSLATAITDRLGDIGLAEATVCVAFQSEGKSGGEWIGPRLADQMARLAAGGAKDLLIAPVGFVADHVETLYDLDIEAADHARRLGFRDFQRMAGMDLREDFIDALEAVARSLL